MVVASQGRQSGWKNWGVMGTGLKTGDIAGPKNLHSTGLKTEGIIPEFFI